MKRAKKRESYIILKKTNATVQIKIKGAIERFVSELELSICKINPHGRWKEMQTRIMNVERARTHTHADILERAYLWTSNIFAFLNFCFYSFSKGMMSAYPISWYLPYIRTCERRTHKQTTLNMAITVQQAEQYERQQ